MTTETLTWRPASDPPDRETMVLISISGGYRPVWLGYLGRDGAWWYASGCGIDGVVVAWSQLPEGWFP